MPRRVSKVLTVQYDRVIYLLEDTVANRSLIHNYLDVFEYPDGALAILIAARRTDIASIRTVADNLGDEFINRLHDVSWMPQSEDAIDFASRVAAIPQIHFSGASDTVVPPVVA